MIDRLTENVIWRWAGRLPNSWVDWPLKFAVDLCNEASGDEEDIPYVGLENIESKTGRVLPVLGGDVVHVPAGGKRFRKGQVLFSKLRPYLAKAFVAETEGRGTGELLVFDPRLFEPRFLKYCLLSDPFIKTVDASTYGSKMPRAEWDFIGRLRMPLPSGDIQGLIADYLDRETERIDELVAEKEKMLALLEEKRNVLITRAVTRGLDPKTTMKDSGSEWLGEMPTHWETRRLKFCLKEPMMYGANESGIEDNPDWPRFVRITDIDEQGNLRDETFRSLEPEVARPYLLRAGDVLFARSGATVGKSFCYQESWGESCFAGYLVRARCDARVLNHHYLYHFALTSPYWDQVKAQMIQATIQNFSGDKYENLTIPIPPLGEQQAIVEALNAELSETRELETVLKESIGLLTERRTALITAAVTGQIDVAGAN